MAGPSKRPCSRVWQSLVLRLLGAASLWLIDVTLAADVDFPNATVTTLAFGSCHKRKYTAPHVWRSVQAQQPQAWLWTGDSVYPPAHGMASVELLEEEYRQMKTNASLGYATFQPPLGIFGTWDDHDYGGNDMGSSMPDQAARSRAFWDFLGRQPPSRHGLYHSVSWGNPPSRQVQVFFLDTRSFRRDHCVPSVATYIPLGAGIACLTRWLSAGLWPSLCQAPDNALLGHAQWDWLATELSQSQASVNVIVSSIQVLTTNPVMETWGHFPLERAKLLQLISDSRARGVVLLSGDVHHGEILDPWANWEKSGADTFSSLLEVTSSGMTHTCTKGLYGALCRPLLDAFASHRQRPDAYYTGRNFGILTIDWSQATFTVNVLDQDGRGVLSTGPQKFNQRALTPKEVLAVPDCVDGHLQTSVFVAIVAGLLWVWARIRNEQNKK
jgi:alkaline phosphatase D